MEAGGQRPLSVVRTGHARHGDQYQRGRDPGELAGQIVADMFIQVFIERVK